MSDPHTGRILFACGEVEQHMHKWAARGDKPRTLPMHRLTLASVLAVAFAAVGPTPAVAQPADLLLPEQASVGANRSAAPAEQEKKFAQRERKARVNVRALEAQSIRLALFDDIQPILNRVSVEYPSDDTAVWVGEDELGSQAVLTVSRGVLSGTVFADHRTFEISVDESGEYSVVELDSASFPTDDPEFDESGLQVPDAVDLPDAVDQNVAGKVDGNADAADTVALTTTTTSSTTVTTTPVEIAVMIVWTPRAETAAGGRSAMDALALNAVANANLVYANSGVAARLKLVYKAPVSYTESPSKISTDLNNLRGTTDGKIDQVHTIRNQYRADIVTLIGSGYSGSGSCGLAGLMMTPSTSFASSAFSVVDRTCALGNLSYAHEVGHNQGLQHNPQNAGNTPSRPYAYGYQDPSGYFRTVLSYGSAKRIPYLSSPRIKYNTRATGTSSQDNARALNSNATIVASFRGGCTITLSTTALTFSGASGSKSITVSAPSGCAWSASESADWIALTRSTSSGSGTVTVSVTKNGSTSRSKAITVAGKSVMVTQAAY
jgi:peptidyl-Asp metalloendopeptidase